MLVAPYTWASQQLKSLGGQPAIDWGHRCPKSRLESKVWVGVAAAHCHPKSSAPGDRGSSPKLTQPQAHTTLSSHNPKLMQPQPHTTCVPNDDSMDPLQHRAVLSSISLSSYRGLGAPTRHTELLWWPPPLAQNAPQQLHGSPPRLSNRLFVSSTHPENT